MHTLHWFAVEAENKEEAFDQVQARLSYEDGEKFVEWSDWHVVGGGRWSDSQYEDSPGMILSNKANPELFKFRLNDIKQTRIEINKLNNITMRYYRATAKNFVFNIKWP